MIYTLISDLNSNSGIDSMIDARSLTSSNPIGEKTENRIVSDQNRDCRILRQPLSLIPENIKAFIEGTKNKQIRAERQLAYTILLCGLKVFFGVEDCDVKKTPDGKPFVTIKDMSEDSPIKYQKNEDFVIKDKSYQKKINYIEHTDTQYSEICAHSQIYISISHSDGAIAVSISDEGEVGVDIQREIPDNKAERLNNRFLTDVKVVSEDLNIVYYYCHIDQGEAIFNRVILPEADTEIITSKWAFSEAVMKLYGKGFGDLGHLTELSGSSKTEIREYRNDRQFIIATSIAGKN